VKRIAMSAMSGERPCQMRDRAARNTKAPGWHRNAYAVQLVIERFPRMGRVLDPSHGSNRSGRVEWSGPMTDRLPVFDLATVPIWASCVGDTR
jgi:hypothetical protein